MTRPPTVGPSGEALFDRMREVLQAAHLQLEYLDERWPIGTTPPTVAKIEAVLRESLFAENANKPPPSREQSDFELAVDICRAYQNAPLTPGARVHAIEQVLARHQRNLTHPEGEKP